MMETEGFHLEENGKDWTEKKSMTERADENRMENLHRSKLNNLVSSAATCCVSLKLHFLIAIL